MPGSGIDANMFAKAPAPLAASNVALKIPKSSRSQSRSPSKSPWEYDSAGENTVEKLKPWPVLNVFQSAAVIGVAPPLKFRSPNTVLRHPLKIDRKRLRCAVCQ